MQPFQVLPCPPVGGEEGDDPEKNGEIKTCHLCGKASCGQRKGRVRCSQCKRVFCIQQLFKKFKIKATPNQSDFICPRCRGICCCVNNCQLGPPHVHCKVFKVRENKRKCRQMTALDNKMREKREANNLLYTISQQPQLIPTSVPIIPRSGSYNGFGYGDILPKSIPEPSFQNGLIDTQSDYVYKPYLQNDSMLLDFTLGLFNTYAIGDEGELNDKQRDGDFRSQLETYFSRVEHNPQIEMELVNRAIELERKAEKVNAVHQTVMEYNEKSLHVTASWTMENNTLDNHSEYSVIPGLFTIIHCCGNILFSLETNTDYVEKQKNCSVSITFYDTSSSKSVALLRTCIAILNTTFSHFEKVTYSEKWSQNIDLTSIPKNEQLYKRMIDLGIQKGKEFRNAELHYVYQISFKRHRDDHIFENLPFMALSVKRVHFSEKYRDVIFSLTEMKCDEERVCCTLVFDRDVDFKDLMTDYKGIVTITKINP